MNNVTIEEDELISCIDKDFNLFRTLSEGNNIDNPYFFYKKLRDYDPVFYIPDHQATMAELPDYIKNQISHRAKAFMAMIPIIKSKLLEN